VSGFDQFPPPADPEPPVPTAAPRGGDRRQRRRRRRRIVLSVLSIFVLVVVGLVAFYEIEAHPFGGPGRQVVLTVQNNESSGAAIDTLAKDGVVGSAFAFRLSEFVHGTPTIAPGSYLFHKNESFSTVRNIFSGGPNVFPMDVPEGFTLAEVTARVNDLPIPVSGSFAQALTSGAVTSPYSSGGSEPLEGVIATGQYLVLPREKATTLLAQMVDRFTKQAKALHLDSAASALGITPAQLVVVASIVEKEGEFVENMGKVSRVIYNRLAKGSPLQMDSTILYSLGQDGGTVTAADLKINTPYNTYLHTGLPPTPICTPSKAALSSAAHPTPGQWLYFELVSKDGTEQFSDTFAEQLAAEALAKSRGLP
jgi:UPF0755 protein